MKLTFVSMIAVTIWSCSGELEDQTTSTLSDPNAADAESASYLVGITMEMEGASSTKEVELIVYRTGGSPTCVGVSGLGTTKNYVPLKKSGTGEWKVGANEVGTYDRYGNTNSDDLDVTLHWTKTRKNLTMNDISLLEYFSVKQNNGLYEYRHDADEKLGMTIGELSDTTPNNTFEQTCDG